VEVEDYAKLDVTRDENGDLCTFHDLSLARAARLLGMDPYVNEMFHVYARHIKSGGLSFEDVDSVMRLALKKDEALLLQLEKRIGEIVLLGAAAEVFPWLEAYLEDNPWLKLWVDLKIAGAEQGVT
jgi:hypothetical protein